ncbi:hypothetical protein ACLI1A_03795 [Flavobacterium sp. RHBU_3]|uniref:hypothetical protein n=1 Tax=Flavobacterium sp. RHBU_3 TaxID=3391184 RepID=UPI00398509E4
MIFAIDFFSQNSIELDKNELKLLLNIEDLNNIIFNEVLNSLSQYKQEQYIAYKESEQAKTYREERDAKLPYVDFNHLPKILDDVLLHKILLYQEDGLVRLAISDSLSHKHKTQITKLEWKLSDQEEEERRASLTDEERKAEDDWKERIRNNPTAFYGNIAEPDNADSYILKYGINPYTNEPETIESFYAKYTIDTKTGKFIPKTDNK